MALGPRHRLPPRSAPAYRYSEVLVPVAQPGLAPRSPCHAAVHGYAPGRSAGRARHPSRRVRSARRSTWRASRQKPRHPQAGGSSGTLKRRQPLAGPRVGQPRVALEIAQLEQVLGVQSAAELLGQVRRHPRRWCGTRTVRPGWKRLPRAGRACAGHRSAGPAATASGWPGPCWRRTWPARRRPARSRRPGSVWNSSTTSVTGWRALGRQRGLRRDRAGGQVQQRAADQRGDVLADVERVQVDRSRSCCSATSWRKSIVDRGWPTIWRATRLPRYLWTLVWTGLMISSRVAGPASSK